MCPRAYTVRPHVYIRTVLSRPGVKVSSLRVSVLYRRIALVGGFGSEQTGVRILFWKPVRLAVDASSGLGHGDRNLVAVRAKLDVAAKSAPASGRHARCQ